MPVPRGEFEAEVLFRIEVPSHRAHQANNQEDRADDDMRAMKAGRHKESSAVDVAAKVEGRVRVLIGLHASEGEPQQNCEDKAPFQALSVVLEQCMMRPRHRGPRGK